MELSADNIDELAIAMSGNSNTIGSVDSALFQEKSFFSNLDVDQVISDAQECLLSSSIESVRSHNESRLFNDILDDICDMNRIESEQPSNTQVSFQSISDLPMGAPAFYHMPDISLQGEYTPDCSFSNQTDFLQPLGQWPEYLSSPPPAFSAMQDIPQLAPVPPTPPPVEVAPTECTTINVNLEQPPPICSTPVYPVQHNNFHFNFSTPMAPAAQQCDNFITAAEFCSPVEKNINFLMLNDPTAGPVKKSLRSPRPPPSFDWARVVPRKAFIQPSEVVILRPLRTRKVMTSRSTFDLSSYFDTSSISIPMIRERPRCKNTNRRKQKLRTIPGADNLMFEVQLKPVDEGKDNMIEGVDVNNNSDHLYPEMEIPELDEIFKRKRRVFSTRRNIKPSGQAQTPTSSHSREEAKEVVPLVPSPEQSIEHLESNSDMDSDDAPLTIVKSMKCQNCRKIFKTCRSLTIHSKRCATIRQTPEREKNTPAIAPTRSKASMQSGSSKENVGVKGDDDKPQRLVERPHTRSQTKAAKRKAGGSGNVATAKKRA